MEKLKKLSIFIILLGGLFLFTGCTSNNVEGSLEDIMTKVYAEIPEEQRPMGLTNMEINSENIEGFLGTDKIEFWNELVFSIMCLHRAKEYMTFQNRML